MEGCECFGRLAVLLFVVTKMGVSLNVGYGAGCPPTSISCLNSRGWIIERFLVP